MHMDMTFLLRHENTSITDKTNNPNQLREQHSKKHNYYCTVASQRCDKTLNILDENIVLLVGQKLYAYTQL